MRTKPLFAFLLLSPILTHAANSPITLDKPGNVSAALYDAQGRLVRYFVEGPVDAEIARLYFTEFHNRREAEVMPAFDSLRRSPAGVRSADELDHEGFFRSDLYNEIWRPQGLRTRLEAVVRARTGQLLGSLVLYRGPGERRFTRDDEERLAAVLPAALRVSRALDALVLGEASARSLGVPLPQVRLLLVGTMAMATGAAVAQAGLIAFVGLVAPHLVRRCLSVAHGPQLALSAMAGGVLLLASDIAARTLVAPQELPVGVLTAVLGGIYLLALLHRRQA